MAYEENRTLLLPFAGKGFQGRTEGFADFKIRLLVQDVLQTGRGFGFGIAKPSEHRQRVTVDASGARPAAARPPPAYPQPSTYT